MSSEELGDELWRIAESDFGREVAPDLVLEMLRRADKQVVYVDGHEGTRPIVHEEARVAVERGPTELDQDALQVLLPECTGLRVAVEGLPQPNYGVSELRLALRIEPGSRPPSSR